MSDRMREAFEAWMSDGGRYPQAVERSGYGYRLSASYAAWSAWQAAWTASRAQTIEECAVICESVPNLTGIARMATDGCAARIRRLKEGE